MKSAMASGLFAVSFLASPCAAQWWWPPTNGLEVTPSCVTPAVQASLNVSGQWPDNCIPNFISALVDGTNIEVTTVRDPPPGFCLTVISNWSLSVSITPLPAGTYNAFVTHRVAGQIAHPRVQIGTLTVVASCGGVCYANCDESSGSPQLTANDFACFLNRFVAGESYANCDASTGTPSLTANDFVCFLSAFANGCS
jgi:hypothetical protein